MGYNAYIVKVKELRKHNNADKLQIATFFGNDTVVDLNVKEGDIGIYFPTDGQLSIEFCEKNNLVRKKDETGKDIGGYMDPEKRNVKTIKLRGEKSDGIYLPISCLDYMFTDGAINHFNVGDRVDIIEGKEICTKYIPKAPKSKMPAQMRAKKIKIPTAPLFKEHADTEQLDYNLGAFKAGDEVEITLKMHGTSQRTGYLPVLKSVKKSLLDYILRRPGKPIYDWGYVSGTRRTVLDNFDGGFYGDNTFREQHSKFFEGKLLKGETVYYEVVGYTTTSQPIMNPGDNTKLDKEFVKKYGKKTFYNYGCEEGESKAFVYRMTMINEDGDVVEYTPDFMRYRCEQMCASCVPVFEKFIIPDNLIGLTPGEFVRNRAIEYYDGTDPVGKTHVREGVVCRVLNRPTFTAYKIKNFSFKVLEGIAKEAASAPDMEEAQELLN